MQIKQYQVDAFASRPFEGNPAAVCVLERWLADDVLQAIAEENNLSETAFFVPCDTGFELRWFTPTTEVDLCGHATLATAHVIFDQLGYSQPAIRFHTRSGELHVKKHANMLQMDFPAQTPVPCEIPDALVRGLGVRPARLLRSDDYLAVFDSEQDIRALQPDFAWLGQLDLRMTVEGGNKLTLLIAAERNDMAQLLQRHIEELKGTLQENGLEVTGAEVQTRDDFERQQNASDADGDATTDAQDDFAEDAATAPRNRGYITAEGLDFWA